MVILIRLDLSKYTIATVLELYRERIVSKEEVMDELRERGLNELQVLFAVRRVG